MKAGIVLAFKPCAVIVSPLIFPINSTIVNFTLTKKNKKNKKHNNRLVKISIF